MSTLKKNNVEQAENEFTLFTLDWMKKWEDKIILKTNISIELTDKKDSSYYSVDISDDITVLEKITPETIKTKAFSDKILDCWFRGK